MSDSTTPRAPREGNVLAEEHLLLGGVLEDDACGRPEAAYYGDGAAEPGAFLEGCALADMGGLVATCVSGEAADSFVSMVFTGPVPDPGRVGCALALMGDGRVVAPALVAGLAEHEFCVWTPAETAQGLKAWMEGIRAVEQDGSAPFDSVELTLGAPFSCTFLLAGPGAAVVLDDYLAEGASLPGEGEVANVGLDAIGTVVMRSVVGEACPYLVVVPDASARVLWRSLLSFDTVVPVGSSAVWGRVAALVPGIVEFLDDPVGRHLPSELGLEGMLRPGGGFIGARALADSDR